MRIGIIDSGIITDYLVESARIRSIENFIYDEKARDVKRYTKYRNNNIHGTLVINTFQKYLEKECDIYVCNVIDKKSKGSSLSVISALEYLKTIKDIKMIIMSLALSNCYQNKLNEILSYYYHKSVVIIVSANQHSTNNYLAENQYVFAAEPGENMPIGSMYMKNCRIILSNIEPEFIRARNGRYYLFKGTSKAAPVVGSLLANSIIDSDITIQEIKKIMNKQKCNFDKQKELVNKSKLAKIEISKKMIVDFYNKNNLSIETLDLTNVSLDNLYKEIVNAQNLDIFIKFLENIYGIKINLDQMFFKDFKTLTNLEKYITYMVYEIQ